VEEWHVQAVTLLAAVKNVAAGGERRPMRAERRMMVSLAVRFGIVDRM
jgi:hypothetical protein